MYLHNANLTTQLQQTSTRKANILEPGTAYSVLSLSNIVYIFMVSLDLDMEEISKYGENRCKSIDTGIDFVILSLLKRRPRPVTCYIHNLFWWNILQVETSFLQLYSLAVRIVEILELLFQHGKISFIQDANLKKVYL